MDAVAQLSELLLSTTSDELKSAVAFTLGNLLSGRDITAQDTLRETGALAELVLLLSSAFAQEVNACAAWAIHHGVYHNHENQSLVGEAGGLSLLLELVCGFKNPNSANNALETNALLALLSCVRSHLPNQKRLKELPQAKERLEEALEKLLQEEDNNKQEQSSSNKQSLQKILQEIA